MFIASEQKKGFSWKIMIYLLYGVEVNELKLYVVT